MYFWGYCKGMKKLLSGVVVASFLGLGMPFLASAQTPTDTEIHAQLESLLAQLIQMVSQLQAQLAEQLAGQAQDLRDLKQQGIEHSSVLDKIEKNTTPIPATAPQMPPQVIKELIVKANKNSVSVNEDVSVIVQFLENSRPVQFAPFTVSMRVATSTEEVNLFPNRSLATNTTGRHDDPSFRTISLKGWYSDFLYTPTTPGEYIITVNSGDKSESLSIIAR